MSSTILTKISTVTPRNFAQQIDWMQGESDFEFLIDFVKHCHKNGDFVTKDPGKNMVEIATVKSAYRYTAYQKHIVRIDLVTTKKTYYAIN